MIISDHLIFCIQFIYTNFNVWKWPESAVGSTEFGCGQRLLSKSILSSPKPPANKAYLVEFFPPKRGHSEFSLSHYNYLKVTLNNCWGWSLSDFFVALGLGQKLSASFRRMREVGILTTLTEAFPWEDAIFSGEVDLLWMEEILHQLVYGLSHCNPIIYSVL